MQNQPNGGRPTPEDEDPNGGRPTPEGGTKATGTVVADPATGVEPLR